VSVVQSLWWLFSSCSHCSILKTVRPERFLDEVQSISVYQSILLAFFLILDGPMLQCFRSLSCLHILLALGRWLDLPKCPVVYTLHSSHRTKY
jgi:hypothetical protein